jgi:hypothetical protein
MYHMYNIAARHQAQHPCVGKASRACGVAIQLGEYILVACAPQKNVVVGAKGSECYLVSSLSLNFQGDTNVGACAISMLWGEGCKVPNSLPLKINAA